MDNESNGGIVRQVTDELLETMRMLREKKISAQEATASAVLGRTVIDAAKAETDFIRAVKGMPSGGIWSKRIDYLEPPVDTKTANAYGKELAARASESIGCDEMKKPTKSEEFGPTAEEWK